MRGRRRIALTTERDLVAAIRALPRVAANAHLAEVDALATRHGLDGVLHDAWSAAQLALPPDAVLRGLAREADHEAHLHMLRRIDDALASASLEAVVLKGALLAARLYPHPAARPTSDIDLLVRHDNLDRAMRALEAVGYRPSTHPRERHFLRRGHHVHLDHDHAPTLELHFHAYRGFGQILRSEPLLDGSEGVDSFHSLRALSPADELLYLAVHAAAHRFVRLGWTYDLVLLLERHGGELVAEAGARAERYLLTKPFALAMRQVEALVGPRWPHARRDLGPIRRRLVSAMLPESPDRSVRAATRLVYTLALCDGSSARREHLRALLADRWARMRER